MNHKNIITCLFVWIVVPLSCLTPLFLINAKLIDYLLCLDFIIQIYLNVQVFSEQLHLNWGYFCGPCSKVRLSLRRWMPGHPTLFEGGCVRGEGGKINE